MIAKAKGKKKFLKIFIISLSSFILLSLIAFWVITSSAFMTGVILPAISEPDDFEIAAAEVDFSIFKSHLTAKNIVIRSGKTVSVKAESLDADFSLLDLLKGRYIFRDVLLDKAAITIAINSNDKSPAKVSPKTSSPESVQTKERLTAEKAEKILLDLKNIQITNSSFILTSGTDKSLARMELKDLNINLPEFKNNSPSTLTLKSSISIQSNSGITVEHGAWNTTLNIALDDYLYPYEIKLDSKLNKLDGVINGVKLNNSNLAFNIDGHGDKKSIIIKKISLRQMDKELIKTNLELNSYINFEPFTIKGKIKIAPLSSEISSIICQFTRQINPGKVGASLVSDFEYSNNDFAAAGQLQITRENEAVIAGKKYNLPDMNLNSKYDFKFDASKNALHVKYFNTELKDRGEKVLLLNTDRDFTYFFDKQTFLKKRKPEVALELRQLDLTMLKLLQAPDGDLILYKGKLNGDIVCILDYNQKLRFGANVKANDLDFQIGSKRFKNIGFEQKISGFITNNLFLAIPEFHLKFTNKQKKLLTFSGIGNIDLKKYKADFSLAMGKLSSDEINTLPLAQETINDISKITKKLDTFSLTAALSASVKLDKGTIKLNPIDFNILQQNKKVLNLSIHPHAGLITNFTKKSISVLTVNNLSIKQVKRLINDKTLTDGYMNGRVIAKVKDDLKTISLDSSLTIDELELLRMKKIFKNLRFNLGFTAVMHDFDEIKIRQFVCGMQQKKQVILGLSGFGDLKLSKGNGKLDLALDYLNHKSLNIITPGTLKNGILKGKLEIDINEHFKNLKIKSHLDMMQLIGGSIHDAVGGKSFFDIELKPDLFLCKKFFVSLNNKNGEIVNINGSTSLPKADSGKVVIINLNSKIIDIDKIKKLFEAKVESVVHTNDTKDTKREKTAETEKTKKTVEPLKFNFGTRNYVLKIDLRGIKHSSVLTATMKSEIIGRKRQISVEHLQIVSNKDKVNFQGNFLSTAKGIKYNVDIKSDKLDLDPTFQTFLTDDLKKMKGTLKKLHIKLAGTGLQSPVLWDNMRGFARSDFENVKIPNDFSKTNMGKIFLLPFEIMVKIQGMIPDKAVKSMGRAARYVLEFQRDMKVLNFTEGKMDLDASDGIIRIRDFHLNGKIVKNLSFIGNIGLGSRQFLDLKSSLDVNGIVLPVEMSGTVENPEINYSATTLKFMSANAFTILDVTNEFFEKGGDAKKILDSIFK